MIMTTNELVLRYHVQAFLDDQKTRLVLDKETSRIAHLVFEEMKKDGASQKTFNVQFMYLEGSKDPWCVNHIDGMAELFFEKRGISYYTTSKKTFRVRALLGFTLLFQKELQRKIAVNNPTLSLKFDLPKVKGIYKKRVKAPLICLGALFSFTLVAPRIAMDLYHSLPRASFQLKAAL